MWIFNEEGFFSVVRHRNDPDKLLVRGRVREDLVRFCRAAGLDETMIEENSRYDYRFRVTVSEETFARFMTGSIQRLDYDNFKDRTCWNPDDPPGIRWGRSAVYHDIWDRLRDWQEQAANRDG